MVKTTVRIGALPAPREPHNNCGEKAFPGRRVPAPGLEPILIPHGIKTIFSTA